MLAIEDGDIGLALRRQRVFARETKHKDEDDDDNGEKNDDQRRIFLIT